MVSVGRNNVDDRPRFIIFHIIDLKSELIKKGPIHSMLTYLEEEVKLLLGVKTVEVAKRSYASKY